mmetsp:Transcript_102686/g.295649  ORF Transcript_102686/g.295649 Transcript_102686/m.295649 type:complete len:235 (-) Transcript_102686:1025-1729(-)
MSARWRGGAASMGMASCARRSPAPCAAYGRQATTSSGVRPIPTRLASSSTAPTTSRAATARASIAASTPSGSVACARALGSSPQRTHASANSRIASSGGIATRSDAEVLAATVRTTGGRAASRRKARAGRIAHITTASGLAGCTQASSSPGSSFLFTRFIFAEGVASIRVSCSATPSFCTPANTATPFGPRLFRVRTVAVKWIRDFTKASESPCACLRWRRWKWCRVSGALPLD